MFDVESFRQMANQIRLDVLDMTFAAGSGHIGGSFSSAEILTVLYGDIMRIDPSLQPGRDRLILSKGHAAPALYAAMANNGFFPREELITLRDIGSKLQGHPCMFKLPGVEISTGSLGMGISVGLGMALAATKTGQPSRVFVVCGDGELQEGQNWEGFMSVVKWQPDNLIITIDRNRVQLDGTVDEIMPMGDLSEKIRAFGLTVYECDGHDVTSLRDTYREALSASKPSVIVAKTIKGKGVSFMEGQSAWHGKPINKEQYEKAVKEIRGGMVWR